MNIICKNHNSRGIAIEFDKNEMAEINSGVNNAAKDFADFQSAIAGIDFDDLNQVMAALIKYSKGK
jgi:hypothetical protein